MKQLTHCFTGFQVCLKFFFGHGTFLPTGSNPVVHHHSLEQAVICVTAVHVSQNVRVGVEAVEVNAPAVICAALASLPEIPAPALGPKDLFGTLLARDHQRQGKCVLSAPLRMDQGKGFLIQRQMLLFHKAPLIREMGTATSGVGKVPAVTLVLVPAPAVCGNLALTAVNSAIQEWEIGPFDFLCHSHHSCSEILTGSMEASI